MKIEEAFQSIQTDAVKVCKSINSCKTAEQMNSCLNLIDLYERKWPIDKLKYIKQLLIAYSFWAGSMFVYRQLKERELNIETQLL